MRTSIKIFLAALLLLAICLIQLRAAPASLGIWTWRNPLPTGNQLYGIAHGHIGGAGLFVAVGTNSTIVTSPDGAAWDQQVVPANCSLASVVYNPDSANHFVAVGVDTLSGTTNVILTSADGTNWAQNVQSGGVGMGGFSAVAYGGGNFVAVGTTGVVWYSSDGGSTWTAANSGTIESLSAVTYGNNEFAAAGDNSTVIVSTSGQTWTVSTVTNANGESFGGIAYGNNKFVVVGDFSGFFYSSDGGATFGQSASGLYGDSIIYANGEFIAANTVTYYPSIVTSPDGITWNSYAEPPWLFSAIAYDGTSAFVGLGANEIATNSQVITTAADWNNVIANVTPAPLNAIAFGANTSGQNLFVAGGGGYFGEAGVVTSTNGYNWQVDTDSSLLKLYDAFITGLAYGTISVSSKFGPIFIPLYVATLNSSAGSLGYNSVITSSSDGIAWETNYFGTSFILNAVAFGQYGSQPLCVAVGNEDYIVWSANPTITNSWTASSLSLSPSASLKSVAFGPIGRGTFVAVGSPAVILSSSDGANTWNPPSPALSSSLNSVTLYGVTYGNGEFVAVGSGGTILTSPDGVAWTPQNSGTTANFNGVTFANGLFVAVSGSFSTVGGVFISADGVNWMPSPIATPDPLDAVASGDYQYIAVGSDGTIIGSLLPAESGGSFNAGTGCFSFEVSGPTGTYGVYQSDNLFMPLPWNFVQDVTFTSIDYSQLIQDCNAGSNPRGYYYLGAPQ